MTNQSASIPPRHSFRNGSFLLALFTAALLCLPALALAAPFSGGTTGLSSDLVTILAPIAGIAIIAVAILCWFGKISWWWFAGIVVGIVLFFGKDQIVTWIRGLFGV